MLFLNHYVVFLFLFSIDEVTGSGVPLSKSAPNVFPDASYWSVWGKFFEGMWMEHINNIFKVESTGATSSRSNHSDDGAGLATGSPRLSTGFEYTINKDGYKQFINVLVDTLMTIDYDSWVKSQSLDSSNFDFSSHGSVHGVPSIASSINSTVSGKKLLYFLNGSHWSRAELKGFVSTTVRGFFYSDLYTVMTEFISRAHGSFGIQVHSTLEPGVVIVASKGQPMSIAFDPTYPV